MASELAGQFHYRIDSYSHVLQGRHEDVVVHLTAVEPNGRELPAGSEVIRDSDLTARAKSEAERHAEAPLLADVLDFVTWSEDHVREAVAECRGAPVVLHEKLAVVLAPDTINDPEA